MTKIKIAVAVILAAIILFLFMGATVTASADSLQSIGQEETVEPDTSIEETPESDIKERFIEFLKAKYGDDYEYIYEQIINGWGSFEDYLLSFGEKLPAPAQSGWEMFVGWLGEYAVVWAPPLAILIVIVVAVVGKKQFNKIVEGIINKKLAPINNELNMQSKATAAMLKAQRGMLPQNEKFEATRVELAQAEKELLNG